MSATRKTSPSGRVHVSTGDRVRHTDGRVGVVKVLNVALGVATVQWDTGRSAVALNELITLEAGP